LSYAYDSLGRRTASWSLDGTTLPDVLPAGTYDDADRLVSRDGEDHEHDASGHLLDDGTRTLAWNASGELTQAARGTLLETYTYDPLGRRERIIWADDLPKTEAGRSCDGCSRTSPRAASWAT
jgi:YD repeat-containing protein